MGSSWKKSHPVEPITAGGLKQKILQTQTITIINLPKYLFQIEKQTISLCKQGNIEATLACWQHCRARGWTSAERSRKFYPENILIFIYSLKFGRYFKFKWTSGERLRKSCPRNILFNRFTPNLGNILFSSGKRSRKFILRGFSVVLFTCGPGFNVEHLEVKRRRLVNITCSKFYGRPSNAICDSCDDS